MIMHAYVTEIGLLPPPLVGDLAGAITDAAARWAHRRSKKRRGKEKEPWLPLRATQSLGSTSVCYRQCSTDACSNSTGES